ncbi:MAG: hypothetical protein LBQ45_00450 [Mycoplasmataceae bacterium]|nr:hypothetical protein [Mycoplasmataceae bacterium]
MFPVFAIILTGGVGIASSVTLTSCNNKEIERNNGFLLKCLPTYTDFKHINKTNYSITLKTSKPNSAQPGLYINYEGRNIVNHNYWSESEYDNELINFNNNTESEDWYWTMFPTGEKLGNTIVHFHTVDEFPTSGSAHTADFYVHVTVEV